MNSWTRVIFVFSVVGVVGGAALGAAFSWKDTKGEYLDLLYDGRRVTRYMYAYDTSSEQRAFETCKVLHHVFDENGEKLLTNGPDGEKPYLKSVKYPHHRGIFIGWNKLTLGGKSYDTWHMTNGVAQVHQKFLEQKADANKAFSTALIHWKGGDGKVFIEEKRTTTVHRPESRTILLLDFETELKAVSGEVFLNGDPEHAGFQYRAHDDVDKGPADVKAKYLFHRDGVDPKKREDLTNLPWVAMSYGLNGKRYSVLYMSHPDNLNAEAVYSAYRDYGRFGEFFKHTIPDGQTLKLRYRIWIGQGELPERAELEERYSAYIGN
ncbi:MAG: PmoA family protein [Sedimentisphaerales bacterium]|nr:PmoA family protein [Sedimentisphaerales bacterium]